MNVHDKTEQAYRNGYAKGYQDAKKEERHGRWAEINRRRDVEGWIECDYVCSACGEIAEDIHNYCPNCGAIMDLPNITEQTENALRKLGEHREEVDFDYNAED